MTAPLTQAPTLHTKRITLAPISMDHWEAYAATWADPRMTAFIGGTPRDRQTSWTKFQQSAGSWPLLGYGYWTFADRASGAFLGTGGLASLERGIPELEGYPEAGWSFVPDVWGQGMATETVARVLVWADEILEAPEVRCIIDPENIASIRVAEKLGFVSFAECGDKIGRIKVFRRVRGG